MDQSALLESIVTTITSYRDARKIVLFGSRARGDHTPVSDIDIAVVDTDWTREDVALAHDRVEEEVPTALKIDVVGYHLVSRDALRRRIDEAGRVIYERPNPKRP